MNGRQSKDSFIRTDSNSQGGGSIIDPYGVKFSGHGDL